MRTKEFVGGADEEVGIQSRDIHALVGGEVDRVDKDPSSCLSRE
jgi:hypothetical protein